MFERILVAIDGSAASAAGFTAATELASDQQATVVALYVIDDSALPVNFEGAVYPRGYVDSYFAAQEDYGRKLVERAAGTASKRKVSKLEPVIVRSRGHTVADVIVAQARKLKADVIVLGTHGRRGLKRLLMGSDAEQVVRAATVPVLLVRGAYRARRKSDVRVTRTPSARKAAGVATRSAATAV